MADDWYYTQGHERQGPVSSAAPRKTPVGKSCHACSPKKPQVLDAIAWPEATIPASTVGTARGA